VGEGVRDKRYAHPALTHRSPSLTLPHPGREGRVLKRHGEGEGESELGAIIFFLYYCEIMKVSDCKSMKCYVLFILGTAKSHLEITSSPT
jgi:hypothetical protein